MWIRIGLIGSGLALWLYSQPLDAPKPFHLGAAIGIGGVHLWARPTFSIRYHHTFIHLSPVPGYFSFGISQGGIGFFRRKVRFDRPLYIGGSFHQRYWPTRELKGDKRLFVMMGVRVWLEPHLQRFYLEAGIGGQVHWAKSTRILPAIEVRMGGFYRPHRYVPKRLRREGLTYD